MNASEYFNEAHAAATYVALRAADAAKLLSELCWEHHMTGVLRAEIYGHRILWDITGAMLHPFKTEYEILPQGADDIELGNLQQVLAFILAKNW